MTCASLDRFCKKENNRYPKIMLTNENNNNNKGCGYSEINFKRKDQVKDLPCPYTQEGNMSWSGLVQL